MLQVGAGPGFVRYDYGSGQGFTGPCVSGAVCSDPFRRGETKLALNASGAVARRFAGVAIVVTLEDYITAKRGGGIRNDVNIGIGFGLGPR